MIGQPGRHIHVADPPRPVPLTTQSLVLLGGTLSLIGWLVLSFGLLFSSCFFADSEAVTLVTFRGDKGQAPGQVTEIRETSASENDVPILAVAYAYTVAGVGHQGTSYALGVPFGPGDPVRVEYLLADPGRSRIEGMRMRRFTAAASFVLLFPLVGLLLVYFALRHGVRARRMLRRGLLAYGRLVETKETSGSVNDQPVYDLVFRFTDPRDSGAIKGWVTEHEVVHRTHELATLTDETREPILFDPDRPSQAVLVDGLVSGIAFDAQGIPRGSAPKGCLVVLLPVFCVLCALLFTAALG